MLPGVQFPPVSTLLTVIGREVLFAHWSVESEILDSAIPNTLELETNDGSAWIRALVPEDRRMDAFWPFALDRDSMYVGTFERELRQLQPVTGTLRTNTMFEAAGLQPPSATPVLQYSLGFEMGFGPVDGQPVTDRPVSNSFSGVSWV